MQKLEKLIKDDQMETEVRYTFEEIENHLYKPAHSLCKQYNNKYEINELVNEVWQKGKIQKVDNIKFVPRRAYFDMLDYIREDLGGRVVVDGVYHRRFRERTNMHGDDTHCEDKNFDLFRRTQDFRKTYISMFDDKEQVEYILSCLPEKESEVLRKYYLEELSLKEIGEEFGLSECRISTIRKEALQLTVIAARLYKDHKNIIEDQKKNNSLDGRKTSHKKVEEILPEYVSDFEIENEYAVEEDFVLERDWEQ